jgi:hypothetical protein
MQEHGYINAPAGRLWLPRTGFGGALAPPEHAVHLVGGRGGGGGLSYVRFIKNM